MISDLVGGVAKKANDAVVNDARDTVASLEELLAGPERSPVDVEKERALFVRGEALGTPGGDASTIPATPNTPKGAGPPKLSRHDAGKPIEFIHFGHVHPDLARSFEASAPIDDTLLQGPGVVSGRAVHYRAALEREAVLIAGLARSVSSALADKEQKEGKLGTLMKGAADLVGGAGGTATSAASADMKPFLEKICAAWEKINKLEIRYADLHEAGIKLHEVRANLIAYLLGQLARGKASSPAPAPAGILSDLPLIGELPLPGALGEVVGMFRKVGGKLHDVQTALIFGLNVAMQPAIEATCHRISLDMLRGGRSPIYPVWFASEDPAVQAAKQEELAALAMNDPLGGQLATVGRDVNTAVRDAVGESNEAINSAAARPLEIVDFLSKEVKAAPGNRYLDDAFQAATGNSSALGGSEKLGELAVAAFYSAVSDDVPSFMHGFVQDFVGYVFAVCVEFLRSTYRVLVSMASTEVVVTDELVAAGSAHVLTHLVDFLGAKLGLDALLEDLSIDIPPLPRSLPGINWPRGELSAAPIAAELKKLLVDEAAPFLEPVVQHAMSGLATRLNAQRAWAGGALTMEAHLAQLPSELALLFRDLFRPLWELITDTLMGVVSDVVGKALGPAGDALGIAGDGLGVVSGFIADAQKKASELQKFARNVEDKAKALIEQLSSVSIGPGQTDDLAQIDRAADDLMNAAGSDPFSASKGKSKGKKADAASGFPADRNPLGRGVKIDAAELAAVEPKNQWRAARVAGETAAQTASRAAAAQEGAS